MSAELSTQVATISRFRKERFLLTLSEDDFRDRVVRPLLLRQGLKDGRDLCGPTEKGKDAVFVATNPLGLIDVWVVQTKKGPLNLARKASQNIEEAATQLRTALATRVAFVATRERKYPDKAILCASGKINDAARDHIIDQLKDPRITFLDPDELIPLLDQHFPELWLDVDASARPYLRALRRSVEGIEEDLLPALGDRSTAGAATDDMFVTLYLQRTEIRIKRRKGKIEREPYPVEVPINALPGRKERLVVITGSAGSGKTTTLRRIAYVLCTKAIKVGPSDESSRIPILLKASTIAASDDSIVKLAGEDTQRLADSEKPAFGVDDLQRGRVTVLVDALDELADDNTRSSVLKRLIDFHSAYPQCQAVVTSRDYTFMSRLDELAPFARFTLSPISLKQAGQLLDKIQRNRQLPKLASKEIMRRLQDVHGFELSPLLVTIFAATSDYSRKDIPANITELFKKYTEMMLGRWSATKGIGQQFHAPLKDFLLRQIAFEMHRRQVTDLPRVEFVSMISTALSARGLTVEIDALVDEILIQSGLFRTIGDTVEFRHLLLQEFFAGRGIPSVSQLETVIAEDWWQKSVVFFFGEHPDDVKGLQAVRDTVQPRTDAERYRAAITLGLALQACYLVEVKDKVSIFKWVLQVLAMSKESFIEAAAADGSPPVLAFLWYYLFGREAVALSLPRDAREAVATELRREASTSVEQEAVEFWHLVATIETDLDESFERASRRFYPEDQRLLFGLFAGLKFMEGLRIASREEKVIAARVADRLSHRIEHVLKEFAKEFDSVYLELRRGQVEAIPSSQVNSSDTDGEK